MRRAGPQPEGPSQLSYELQLTLLHPALPQPVTGMAKSASPSFLWLTSCPNPAPALPRVMSWQVFLLVSRYHAHSPSGIMRVCLRVYVHQRAWLKHQSADLRWMQPFIALLMTSPGRGKALQSRKEHQTDGRKSIVVDGTRIQSPSWIIVIFFPPLLPFSLRNKYVHLLPPCVCAFNYWSESFCESWLSFA